MGAKDSFLGRLLGNADKYSNEQVAQTITLLITHGVKHGATDIHLEPRDRYGIVRYRIDNTLRSAHKIPINALPAVVEEIKNLADIPKDQSYLPHEGQFATLVDDEELEVQVHTLPVVGGEKVVLRLLRKLSAPLSLEVLGFWGNNLHTLRTALSRTHGLILVGAPRRNSATSTMYSMLQLVNMPSLSIATIEPVLEYRIAGANQTIVRPHQGITFHKALQAVLNQDPNVVMISSLADRPTAESAVQASLSGHLIIAGMHADDASKTLAHIRAMVDEPFLLVTTTRAVVSQRLVRALCVHCREFYTPTQEQIAEIENAFGIHTAAARQKIHQLEQMAIQANLGNSPRVSTTPSHITGLWRANDDGCEHCHHTGYSGVVAATEVLTLSEHVQKAILAREPADKIHAAALKDNFVPMALDGLIKALRGQTTVAEVLRVFSM